MLQSLYIYVRPLLSHRRQAHARGAFWRAPRYRSLRLRADLQRRAIATASHHYERRTQYDHPPSWGFAPEWADEHWTLPPLNNARIEGIDGKHTFHDAYKKRHCLVLADGFFEWKEVGKQKLPYHFTEPHRELFAMAGIWDHSPADGGLPSYAILTTAATGVVSPVHHRMPIILPRESEQSWLLPSSNAIEISSPETAEHLLAYEVTSKVTKASFNNPEAIKPLEAVVN